MEQQLQQERIVIENDDEIEIDLKDLVFRQIPVRTRAHIDIGAVADRMQVIFLQKLLEGVHPFF